MFGAQSDAAGCPRAWETAGQAIPTLWLRPPELSRPCRVTVGVSRSWRWWREEATRAAGNPPEAAARPTPRLPVVPEECRWLA